MRYTERETQILKRLLFAYASMQYNNTVIIQQLSFFYGVLHFKTWQMICCWDAIWTCIGWIGIDLKLQCRATFYDTSSYAILNYELYCYTCIISSEYGPGHIESFSYFFSLTNLSCNAFLRGNSKSYLNARCFLFPIRNTWEGSCARGNQAKGFQCGQAIMLHWHS